MASRRSKQLLSLAVSLVDNINQNNLYMLLLALKNVTRRNRRIWVHEILANRKQYGAFYHLVKDLELDDIKYFEYFRMSPQQLETILSHVGPIISKESMVREAIDAKQRLMICLRFLATGESYRSLASQYRVSAATISLIVPDVCEAIWLTMKSQYMSLPQNPEEWQAKASSFFHRWDYPNCIGALDGKHVVIKAPDNSGSLFYNYKHSFSIVLLALVDADYKFICVDIGAYGKQSDGGIFSASALGKALSSPLNPLKLPINTVISGAEDLGPMPYIVTADEAFPLQQHIMRPYPGKNATREQAVYNYRHSRARRIVENAFGILSEKWRIYHTKIALKPDNVVKVVQATTVLHNMLQRQSTSNTIASDVSSHEVVAGLDTLPRAIGTRGTNDAIQTRKKFAAYFNKFPVPWQDQYIQRGLV